MNEYISREAVVRYLKGYSEKELNGSSFGMITSSVLNKAERAISEMPAADVQPVNGWISVKDKLPEDSGEYLVYIVANNEPKNKSIITLYYTNLSKQFVYYDNDNLFTVTHWMPLPEPPKESDVE